MTETSQQATPRHIPAAVKREVRERCGFGCVLCGKPFYHYDHMHGFDPSAVHDPDDITLLCAGHHDEKSRGLLPLADVLAANSQPKGITDGVTAPFGLHFSGPSLTTVFGTNTFKAPASKSQFFPIVVDGYPLIAARVEHGELLLDMTLRDIFNNPWLVVRSNELVMSSGVEDIEFTGKVATGGSRLVIKDPDGAVSVHIEFDVPDQLTIVQGSFFWNGVWIAVSAGALFINGGTGITISGPRFEVPTGLCIGGGWPYGAGIAIESVARYRFAQE